MWFRYVGICSRRSHIPDLRGSSRDIVRKWIQLKGERNLRRHHFPGFSRLFYGNPGRMICWSEIQLQIQEFINSQKITRIRFTSFEKENTSSGVEYLFHGDDGRNYHRQANGNVYSADASKIPTLSQCRERAKEGIWKIEIKMKEVTGVNESQSQGTGKKMG